MTIETDVLDAELPAVIDLFDINLETTNLPEFINLVYRVTPSGTSNGKPLVFGGHEYIPYPIKIEGIEETSDGAPARPKLTIANVQKLFGTLAFIYNDIVGTEITYRRTFEPYLGTNNSISMPPKVWIIGRKISSTKDIIIFELQEETDDERNYLPSKQMLRSEFPGLGTNKAMV